MNRTPKLLPPTDAPACLFCKAWRHWDTQAVSRDGCRTIQYEPVRQCRAHPPTINRRDVSSTNAEWPVVAASDWCLSFSPTGEIPSTEEAA